jgi:hypothetical protein
LKIVTATLGPGIRLEAKRRVVVRGSQHFHAAFASLPCEKRSLNDWPRVADPCVEQP